MLNLAIVNYLNTKPLLHGLKHSSLSKRLKIIECIPSLCGDLLKSGDVDIALIPSVELLEIPDAQIIPGFCIACNGLVKTVCLVSNNPLNEIHKVYLDDHSRTSNQLVQILLEEAGGQNYEYVLSSVQNLEIAQGEAKLMIGDKAFFAKDNYDYCYDLGLEWRNKTQMPFVFAVWASSQQIDPKFKEEFNNALYGGIKRIPQLIKELRENHHDIDLYEYYTQNIEYILDPSKMEALEHYLDIVKSRSEIKISLV